LRGGRDLLGAKIRFFDTKSFGQTRIAEAGVQHDKVIIFMHGIARHLEAYARNVVALSEQFHTIAFDFVGHGS
jgi:pimeloyl-ACP methyl ester carboxylesterase